MANDRFLGPKPRVIGRPPEEYAKALQIAIDKIYYWISQVESGELPTHGSTHDMDSTDPLSTPGTPVAITGSASAAGDGPGKANDDHDHGFTILATKGDLLVYSTNVTRMAVGTDGYLLEADSTAAPGIAWKNHKGTDDHSMYALKDCTLQLTPVVAMPQDGYTAGINNMYFAAGYALHGRNSLTNNRGLWLWFSLPSQFVADDAVFSLFWVNHVGAAVANCDYNIRIFELVDGQALTLTHNVSGTWAGTGVAGQLNRETYTFDLSAHAAGEGLLIMVRLEDALNANEVYSAAHALKIVADLRQT